MSGRIRIVVFLMALLLPFGAGAHNNLSDHDKTGSCANIGGSSGEAAWSWCYRNRQDAIPNCKAHFRSLSEETEEECEIRRRGVGCPVDSYNAVRWHFHGDTAGTRDFDNIEGGGAPLTIHYAINSECGESSSSQSQTGAAANPQAAEDDLGLSRTQRRQIQESLAAEGFNPGPADGVFGQGTRGAIGGWQDAAGAEATGYLTEQQVSVLLEGGGESGAGAVEHEKPGRVSVTAWVDHDDKIYAVGERVRLFVKTNKDAYVNVFNIAPSGQIAMLFPNAHQKDNKVAGNQVVEIPPPTSGASIKVAAPVGRELIKVVASTSPVPIFSTMKMRSAGPFATLDADARAVVRDLKSTMEATANQEWGDYNMVVTTILSR